MEQVGSWITLQRVTSGLLFFFAYLLLTRPAVQLEQAYRLLGWGVTTDFTALIFAACSGALLFHSVPILTYRITTLPLGLYGLVIGWYALNNNGIGATTAGFGVGLWLLLQLVATKPEP